jgi:cell division protein FtsA
MKVNVEGNEPIHFLTMGYHVDNGEEVKNPINIFGENLSVDILLGLYPRPMYKNLSTVVESSHLEVEMKAFSAYASGLSCLVDDERELGATIIDIGGGTTSIASFKNGHPVYFGSIPVGGINVTNDIALGLTTSFNYAEEVKNRHGCAFLISQDEQEVINVYPVGEEDDSNIKQIYKSDLINIISPRIEEIFELVGRKLDEAGYKNATSHRVVLTGGAAQLPGMREVASMVLDKQVRIGRPRNIENIPQVLHNPTFSTALGLLLFAVNNSEKKIVKKVNVSTNADGIFAKILELFKKTC